MVAKHVGKWCFIAFLRRHKIYKLCVKISEYIYVKKHEIERHSWDMWIVCVCMCVERDVQERRDETLLQQC